MADAVFYWFLWGIWIIAAFLMDKSQLRSQLMFGVLVFILLTGFTVNFYSFNINLIWFALLFWGYWMYRKLSLFSTFTLMFSNLTITLCYVLIRIYWLMDPAIFLVLDKWVFSVLLTGLLMAIVKPLWLRLSTAAIGVCQGDLLISILFYPYDLSLGEVDCITSFTISMMIILGWHGLQQIVLKMQSTLSNQLNHRL